MNFVFDLFGTLIDMQTDDRSAAFWQKAEDIFKNYGITHGAEKIRELYEAAICKRITEPTREPDFKEVFIELFHESGIEPSDGQILKSAWEFRRASFKYVKIYDGVIPMLHQLKADGAYLFILSNAQRIFVQPLLKALGLADFFDGILLSSDFGYKKPDERFFRYFTDYYKLNVEECVYIGNDWQTDIVGAFAAGMKAVYIRTKQSPPDEGTGITPYKISDGDFTKLTSILLAINKN